MLGVMYVGYLDRYEPAEYADFCRHIGVSETASKAEVLRAAEERDMRFYLTIDDAIKAERRAQAERIAQAFRPRTCFNCYGAELPF